MVKKEYCKNTSLPLERFLAFDTIFDFAPHPSGESIAVGTNISGQANLWLYEENIRRRRITPFTNRRAIPIAWNHTGGKLLFRSDFKGNERWQLHLYDNGLNWYRDLIFEDGIVHYSTGFCWSPKGNSFVFVANKEQKDRFDIYVMNVEKDSINYISEGFGGYEYAFWFYPRHIIVSDLRTPEDSALYKIDLKNKGIVELTPHESESIYLPVGCWKDGFFMITDEDRDFKALSYYNLAKKSHKIVFEEARDVEAAAIGRDYLLFSINEKGFSKLCRMSLKNFEIKDVKIPNGVVWSIKQAYGKDIFYITFEGSTKPLDIYELCFGQNFKFKRLTECFYGKIPEDELIEPESYYYESFDKRRIHSLLYKPKKAKTQIPLIVRLHDGPEAQARPCYSPFIQYLLSIGIAVVEPNFRGSSGYGKKFQKLIIRDWGGGELNDVKHLMKHLLRQNWVNPERIGVCGASFGGYLTLSCITMMPKYWRAAVEWFGPSNLITTVNSAQPYWRQYLKERLGDPQNPQDLKRLEKRSPARLIKNIRCPLLIIQGALDIKVPKKDSDRIVEDLRCEGIPVAYMVFNDEGHGFSKETNSKQAIRETVDFLIEYLLNEQ